MNKRKAAQAARGQTKGRKRIAKEMRGGRVVVVTPAHRALLALMHPQIPAALVKRMKANLPAVALPGGEAPVIDLSAPYKPGLSTVDRMAEDATPEVLEAAALKVHTYAREKARRLRQEASCRRSG